MDTQSSNAATENFADLIIYDVGMNTGQDTEFYLKKGFKVIAIEANPVLCEEVGARFSDYIASGALKILNVGVGKEEGKLDFYVNENKTEWSSFHKGIAGRDGAELKIIRVEVLTMQSIIEQYGMPYYLKIDIEGNDGDAIWSALQGDFSIPYVSVENGGPLLKLLAEAGYTSFKYIQQNNVTEQLQVKPVLEGKTIDFTFEFGASGKFGEETDGEWMSFDEVYPIVNDVWDVETGAKNPKWDDIVGGWFDLHARHSSKQ